MNRFVKWVLPFEREKNKANDSNLWTEINARLVIISNANCTMSRTLYVSLNHQREEKIANRTFLTISCNFLAFTFFKLCAGNCRFGKHV